MKNKAAAFLLVLGLATMTGDLLGFGLLKGLGAATAASPAPKVFSAVRGYETYSTRFFLEWRDKSGVEQSTELTPELYSKLHGPYNRRNVFGAALAYGPVLSTDKNTRAMFEAVSTYALTGQAPALAEMGFDPTQIDGPVRVRFVPRAGATMGAVPDAILVGAP